MLQKRQKATAMRSRHKIARSGWRILLWGTLAVSSVSCSKEHEAPVAFHETLLAAPTDLQSEFVANQRIVLTWTMADETNVTGYEVLMSTSEELLLEKLVRGVTTYTEESSLTDGASVDSTWYFFQVSAVDENLFRGPASAVDSVLVD